MGIETRRRRRRGGAKSISTESRIHGGARGRRQPRPVFGAASSFQNFKISISKKKIFQKYLLSIENLLLLLLLLQAVERKNVESWGRERLHLRARKHTRSGVIEPIKRLSVVAARLDSRNVYRERELRGFAILIRASDVTVCITAAEVKYRGA